MRSRRHSWLKRLTIWRALILVTVATLFVATTVQAKTYKGNYPIRVGATVGMVADIGRRLAGPVAGLAGGLLLALC